MSASGRKLAVPRSGSATLSLKPDGRTDPNQENLFAAWQTPEQGIPKRVVVRIDGIVQDVRATEPGQPPLSAPFGIPCAMVRIRYTIGGFDREVLVDAVNQSALVVWAESVDVEGIWDERRISRILTAARGPWYPCQRQQVAVSISASEDGDRGAADARYLDVLAVDIPSEGDEICLFPVPAGARGFRFLNAFASGSAGPDAPVVHVPTIATFIIFVFVTLQDVIAAGGIGPVPFLEILTNGLTDTCINMVPVGARTLAIGFPAGTIASFDFPAYIEWIMAPNTLPAQS